MLDISQIRLDGGTQSRDAIDPNTVDEYAEAMRDGEADFPPVVVYYDGRDYWLADGFHRVEACKRLGLKKITADVRRGERRDAVLHSCGANANHGLRRTNADKRRAVMTLLEDDEWSRWSDREIARRCGVSDKTVARHRNEVTAEFRSEEEPRTYTTKHGTEAQMDTSRIGKVGSSPEDEPSPAISPELQADIVKPWGAADDQTEDHTEDAPAAQAPEKAKADEAPAQEPTPDPYGYSKLTDEALLELANGLREEVDELRAKVKALQGEIEVWKDRHAEATQGDMGATVSNLQKRVAAANYKRDEAMAATKRMEYRMKQAQKRVQELESAVIPL